MAYRFSSTAGVQFAITPLSGYVPGPLTVAALVKRSSLAVVESPVTIYTSGFVVRVRLLLNPAALIVGGTGVSGFATGSTSVWFLVVATWAGGGAVPRFHVHDGSSWGHADRFSGTNGDIAAVAGTDQLHVGFLSTGSADYDVVCAGIKKADRTDGQVATLSPLGFQSWRDFGFDWLVGFDSGLEVGGVLQDQGAAGTGDEVATTGTPTLVSDPPGWLWSGAAAPASTRLPSIPTLGRV